MTEILFAGLPNVGKSTLINTLTGSELRVGNWPGTTVERRSIRWKFGADAEPVKIVDLPGSYSLEATSPEEEVTREVLLNSEGSPPRLLVNVVDAGQLERDLYLTLELKELGYPMIVVLNLCDEAKKFGVEVDREALSKRLDLPVVESVAVAWNGSEGLLEAIESAYPWQACQPKAPPEAGEGLIDDLESRFQKVIELSASVTTRSRVSLTKAALWQARGDKALLHPVLGPLLFLIAMLLVFRFTFLLSDPWITFLGTIQEVLAGWAVSLPLPALVTSFLAEGLIGGLGTVAAFSPVLFFLYLGMSFLERSGFLPRIAVIADRLLRSFGLSGRSLIPLLLGFGCNVPALSACRTLDSGKERLKAAIAIPFMSCSARLAVFTLFAAIFFPGKEAMVVFGLYVGGLVVGLLSAVLLTRGDDSKDELTYSVLEIPPFRMPPRKALVKQAFGRTMRFVQGAGRMVTVTVILVWAMLHIPNGVSGSVSDSVYGKVSQAALPIFAPMGVKDPHLVGALIPGIVAKEVVVGSLATSLSGLEPLEPVGFSDGLGQIGSAFGTAIVETGEGCIAMVSGLDVDLAPGDDATPELMAQLATTTTAAGALGYLVFILLYTPCVATVAALRDLVGWRWCTIICVYQLVAAWVIGCLVYWTALFAGFS